MRSCDWQEKTERIQYIANSGVLVEIGSKRILIDALTKSKIPMFKSTPEDIYQQLLNQEPPYDQIDFLLVTHQHSDHFDAERVLSFLRNSQKTKIIAPEEVIFSLRKEAPDVSSERLYGMNPALGQSETIYLEGLRIKGMAMRHEGETDTAILHLAYLMDGGKKVMHLGDAAPEKENFDTFQLKEEVVDVLLANFPYAGIPKARQLVREYIAPKKMAVIHLPDPDKDRWGWRKATQKSYLRSKQDFVKTVFFKEMGERIEI
ncbi:MBL fold metallo-hydrolase [Tindallia californiensis]|uniref:L-ascorbate metabolism protein UlaG, beta-lactamase superfamily n=1 Tax=Tindallia californiensis TaxID=159292 RepID=A0A1H3P7N8_9FIRM|nr:MBL fold metallo-hydrolase [Tindallia californiensis]SDY97122.1 L-ascorbate metabolism protein UlaG, beta-lactamase superfamily [Tindallia californiensis]